MAETSQEDEYGIWETMVGSATRTTSRHQKAMVQRVLNLAASKYLQTVRIDETQPEEVNGFVLYLWNKRKVRIVDVEPGSSIITLEITTPESLEELWMDYRSGHLNEMAQKFLVTEDILKELELTMVTLTTTIKEQEYRDCVEYISSQIPGTTTSALFFQHFYSEQSRLFNFSVSVCLYLMIFPLYKYLFC